LHGRESDKHVLGLVKLDQGADIDIADSVTIGEAKSFMAEIVLYPLNSSTGHRIFTGMNQCHFPWLGFIVMDVSLVVFEVEGYIRQMQGVIGKILLYDMPFISQADNEIIYTRIGINFHDVPQYRPISDLHHRFRLYARFFGKPGSKSTGQDNRFQFYSSIMIVKSYSRLCSSRPRGRQTIGLYVDVSAAGYKTTPVEITDHSFETVVRF
jgi:ABC-type glucose/galactose transport system permease subunit